MGRGGSEAGGGLSGCTMAQGGGCETTKTYEALAAVKVRRN
jgi:hypothetical protein